MTRAYKIGSVLNARILPERRVRRLRSGLSLRGKTPNIFGCDEMTVGRRGTVAAFCVRIPAWMTCLAAALALGICAAWRVTAAAVLRGDMGGAAVWNVAAVCRENRKFT